MPVFKPTDAPRPFDLIQAITGSVFDAGEGWHGGYIQWDERTEKAGTLYYTPEGDVFTNLLIWINRERPLPHWEMSFRRVLEALGVTKAKANEVAQAYAGRVYQGGPYALCYYSNIAFMADSSDSDPDYKRFAMQLGDPLVDNLIPPCL